MFRTFQAPRALELTELPEQLLPCLNHESDGFVSYYLIDATLHDSLQGSLVCQYVSPAPVTVTCNCKLLSGPPEHVCLKKMATAIMITYIILTMIIHNNNQSCGR